MHGVCAAQSFPVDFRQTEVLQLALPSQDIRSDVSVYRWGGATGDRLDEFGHCANVSLYKCGCVNIRGMIKL